MIGRMKVIMEVEKETGCHQGTVADHIQMITSQMAMLQAPGEGFLLKVNLVI